MKPILVAINMQVQTKNGDVHYGVKMFVHNGERTFVGSNGIEIRNVEAITQATSVVRPAALLAIMQGSRGIS